ncbi:fibronectin type III domain-containing protein [Modestobacter sp. VKM Ac-2983]|uniref:fibronectin type III domain-containing protein n=1 Tax=Modestobacter sp. VKM Ac-2983 TaxID=3004137 RepID=UPI0022AB7734|nr:fibronectin type III domain-containing protein [Modestobacter sp. VKM Ac-2983]
MLDGAAGGSSDTSGTPGVGASGSRVATSTTAVDGDVFRLYAGNQGGDADGTVPQVGTGGTNASGVANTAGLDGVETLDPNDSTVVTYGGGGGSASVVTGANGFLVSAKGGAGAGSAGTGGGTDSAAATVSTVTGAGVISGSYTCTTVDPPSGNVPAAPEAPYELSARSGDGALTLRFFPGSDNGSNTAATWEYSVDDGATWKPFASTATEQYSAALTGSVTGLTNGTDYVVRVRGVNTVGNGTASSSTVGTPVSPVGLPANLAVATRPGSLLVTWDPSPAGTLPVGGYEVYYSDLDSGDGGHAPCSPTVTDRTCLIGVETGKSYAITVLAHDTAGNSGPNASVRTGAVPALTVPATLPKSDGTLVSDAVDGKVVAGEKVTITGKDFLPGSTVDVIVYSSPVKLGSAVVLFDGTFSFTATLPKDLVNGTHHLVAAGVDANGNARNMVIEITVSGGVATVTDSGGLAYTGFSPLPFIGAGVLALGAGGGLLVASRRRAQ